MIESETVSLPVDIVGWKNLSALSILTRIFNLEDTSSDLSRWRQVMPRGSPLHWAIRKSNVSAVKLLLQNEAEVNDIDGSGMTPLHLAVCSKYPAKLLRQLLRAGAGLAEITESRIETMYSAIRKGDLEVVKILAEADPEILKGVYQLSAERRLRIAGSTEVFEYLVSQGFDPLRVSDFGDSAITSHMGIGDPLRPYMFNSGLAFQLSEDSLLLTLFRLLDKRDLGSISLLKRLPRALHIGTFARLVNRKSQSMGSAFCLAASINAAGMVQALITMVEELDSEGCRHGSPLMAACAWGNLEVVKHLVRSGALLCYVNEDGLLRSAVSLSCRHEKIKRWLLVDRHTEQQKLDYQPSQSTSHQAVWSGPRLFKLALPVYMQRDFGESRWSHLQRLEKWKKDLLGCTLNQSRRNSGLDFDAELAADSRERDAQAAQRRFLARLGDY